MSEQVLSGTVARIIRNRGFGFLTGADGIERFFHMSSVRPWVNFDALSEGDPITFQEDRSPKGPRAKNIDLGEPSTRRARDNPEAHAAAQAAGNRAQHYAAATEAKTESRTRPYRGGPARSVRTREPRM